MRPGLVSISFRQLASEAIIELASEAGLLGIEWGGDIHCPHGDEAAARRVGELTRAAGLEVVAYGSYYRLGQAQDFAPVLASAQTLGAPVIRVWAGIVNSSEATEEVWRAAESDLDACVAAAGDVRISLEFHPNTLTDRASGARRLIQGRPISTHWQPHPDCNVEENISDLDHIAPWVKNLHVFHWVNRTRRPLAEGAVDWQRYLSRLPSKDHWAMLEHVLNDDPAQLKEDASALRSWIA